MIFFKIKISCSLNIIRPQSIHLPEGMITLYIILCNVRYYLINCHIPILIELWLTVVLGTYSLAWRNTKWH